MNYSEIDILSDKNTFKGFVANHIMCNYLIELQEIQNADDDNIEELENDLNNAIGDDLNDMLQGSIPEEIIYIKTAIKLYDEHSSEIDQIIANDLSALPDIASMYSLRASKIELAFALVTIELQN